MSEQENSFNPDTQQKTSVDITQEYLSLLSDSEFMDFVSQHEQSDKLSITITPQQINPDLLKKFLMVSGRKVFIKANEEDRKALENLLPQGVEWILE